MAYKIQYSSDAARRYPEKTQNSSVKFGRWLLVMAVFVAAVCLRLYGIPDCLIPGDPVVTRQAVSAMMENIQTGTDFGDAVTVFCKKILYAEGY